MRGKLKTALFLDDERIPTETIPEYSPWMVVINYDEFVAHITKHGLPDLVSFDHDLADEHKTDFIIQTARYGFCTPGYEEYTEKTGLDCAKWLVDYCQTNGRPLPLCSVHSFNPVGAANIQSYLNGYNRHTEQPETCFIGKHKFRERESH
jgi:hypothetical protein